MKQGVLTNGRVRLMMSPGDQVGLVWLLCVWGCWGSGVLGFGGC